MREAKAPPFKGSAAGAGSASAAVDYGAVARSFGAHGERVTEAGKLAEALRRALDCGRPAVVDIAVDKEIYAPVVYYEMFEGREV